VPWQHQRPQRSADQRFPGEHRLRVVARGANGLPRTNRLAASSTQNAAYRRLALAILGLEVATLAVELRSARNSASARIASVSIATNAA